METLGGRYRLVEQIGVGGMASVWRAHDEVLDRTVAVKLLTSEDSTDPADFERARNEARSAARLAHPNVGAVYDFGTSRRGLRGAAYVVLELVDGPLLKDYLQGGPLSWRFAVRVCAEVSAGLAEAHSHEIVHRDIKPANVVLTPAGAKLLDFGIAARVGDADRLPDGSVVGTLAYMAPERLTGAPVAPASDLYALGVLLYRNLTARLPFAATTDETMWYAHLRDTPAELPALDGLPPQVDEIYRRCLDKDPANRPTAAGAALLLAASVDAQVYLPTLLERPSRPAAPPATEDALSSTTRHHPPAR